MPAIARRLRWEAPRADSVDPALDRAAMAHAAGYLLLAGGTVGVLATVLPHPEPRSATGALATVVAAYLLGVLVLAALDRLPPRSFDLVAMLGTGLAAAGVHFARQETTLAVVLYLWVALYAAYFFSRTRLYVQLVVIAAAHGALIASDFDWRLASWLLVVATVTATALMFRVLRERVESLIVALGDAARRDPLTGILNRRGLSERLAQETARSARSGGSLSLVLLDVDGLKALNDARGHRAGDDALVAAARALQDAVRTGDSVGRLGGDEFALVLPDADGDAARKLAERVRRAVESATRGLGTPLTVSAGLAQHRAVDDSPDALLDRADAALYASKRSGGNRLNVAGVTSRQTEPRSGTA